MELIRKIFRSIGERKRHKLSWKSLLENENFHFFFHKQPQIWQIAVSWRKKDFLSGWSRTITSTKITERACTIWSTFNKLYTTAFFLPFTCLFCPISHSSLTRRKEKHRIKTSQRRRRKILRLKTESNIDWIFSACASIFTSANSRFACLLPSQKRLL